MRDEVRQALAIDRSASLAQRTIDITTIGRRSGEPRRIETVFYRVDDSIYLSGIPAPRPRAWLLNMTAEPRFTFHLKHGLVADLQATATVITEPAERRRVFSEFVEDFNRRNAPGGQWPQAVLDDWVASSPLVKVSFDEGQ